MKNQSNIPTTTTLRDDKLTFTGREVNEILNISDVTRWRLEKRGLLKPVQGIRHKLYAKKVVMAFIDGTSVVTR